MGWCQGRPCERVTWVTSRPGLLTAPPGPTGAAARGQQGSGSALYQVRAVLYRLQGGPLTSGVHCPRFV